MTIPNRNWRGALRAALAFALLLGAFEWQLASQQQLFVTTDGDNRIGEYTRAGTSVKSWPAGTGFAQPYGIAVSGTHLFVAMNNNTVDRYTTPGITVNTAFISGLNGPIGIAVAGTNLFVANSGANTIGGYTTSGDEVSASLISGLANPQSLCRGSGPQPDWRIRDDRRPGQRLVGHGVERPKRPRGVWN
jgi:hypothetical protein